MANLIFAGTDLSAIGAFQTPEISGLLDLVTMEQTETWLPGRDAPELTDVRRRFGDVKVKCVLRSDDGSRATFLSNLQTLKAALSPALGAQFLTRTDVADKMVLCQSLGFPVTEDTLPYIMDVGEFTLTFRRLGWWMDTALTTAYIDPKNLLTLAQATCDTAITGWAAYNTGVPTLDTGNAYAGAGALKVVAPVRWDGATTPTGVSGIPVVAASVYSWQGRLKSLAASQDIVVQFTWYTAAGAFISNTSTTFAAVGTAYALKTYANVTAPALSAFMRIAIFSNDAAGGTFWVDNQQFELSATATTWAAPSPGSIYQNGDLEAIPTYTATVTATLASGLTFTVNGQTFDYDGALAPGDVLVVDTDLATVTKNGSSAIASVNTAAKFPRLPVGTAAVSLSAAGFSLAASYRRRWE